MSASVTGPPPRASNRTLKPWALMASSYSFSQFPFVTITCLAPSDRSRSACSCLLTMLSRGIPSLWAYLLSCLPRAEAAAVWMIPFPAGNFLYISVIPMTVRGFTRPEAADSRGTSSSITKDKCGIATEYSAHAPEPFWKKEILLPTQCWIAYPAAFTTLPTPSNPNTAGRGSTKQTPLSFPLSDGLMVEPSTLTRSCPSLISGMGLSSRMGSFPVQCCTNALGISQIFDAKINFSVGFILRFLRKDLKFLKTLINTDQHNFQDFRSLENYYELSNLNAFMDTALLKFQKQMGNSQVPVHIEQVPNSKKQGFSAIYRKKGLTALQQTPEESIRSVRDLLKAVKNKYGSQPGIGEIVVTKEKGAEGEEVEKRGVRQHTYNQVFDQAYNLGRYIHSQKLYLVEEVYKMKLIGIYSRNRYEWFLTDWACALFGVTSVPLYDTLGVENLTYCLKQTLITSIFVTNATIKVLLKLKDMGNLKTIISYEPLDQEAKTLLKAKNVLCLDFWDILYKGGELKNVSDAEVKIGMDDCYTFSYTSGTTGPPKGAMISNRNILASTNTFSKHPDLNFNSQDRYLSYLPLPHLMERSVTMVLFYCGAHVILSSGNNLKLKEDCQASKVTVFISVPRIYSRIVEGVKSKFEAETGLKKCIIDCGVSSKLDNAQQTGDYTHSFYDSLVFSKVRQGFGGQVRLMATGSAPISPEVHAYMKAIMCCPLIEGYGQTESSAGVLFSREKDTTFGMLTEMSSGLQLKLCDIPEMKYTSKDVDANGKACPRGELWKRGPQVFMGYYKQPEVTKETLTEDGWLRTGDVAEIHLDNYGFKIIDRKKNIFKLQQGEYLAPDRIESFYAKCSLVSEIFLHGESIKNYAVAIVSPNREQLERLAQAKGIKGSFEQLCANKEVRKIVLGEMNSVGRKEGLNGFELAKNVHLDPKGFLARGILTNTMKLIRFQARKVYKKELEALYQEGELPIK